MEVRLTPDIEEFIAERVAAGDFANPQELVLHAIEQLKDDHLHKTEPDVQKTVDKVQNDVPLDADEMAWLRREIQIGIDELDAGLSEPFDVEKIIKECHEEFDAKRNSR